MGFKGLARMRQVSMYAAISVYVNLTTHMEMASNARTDWPLNRSALDQLAMNAVGMHL